MGKMIVLKPLVWSSNGYRSPAGIKKSGKDYVAKNGFGHEEWNGDPERLWNGQRVFHTEVRGRMKEYGQRGDLGIIMTAYGPDGPHAVGIATSVTWNSEIERVSIASAIGARALAGKMWALESVKRRHKNFLEFEAFWEKECEWIPWRCPLEQYVWFANPVKLRSEALFPPTSAAPKSPHIIKMFSAYMPITSEQALSVVWNSLDEDSPVVEWLMTGTFDEVPISKRTRLYGRPQPAAGRKQHSSAPPPEEPYIRYIRAQEIAVSPRHKQLQCRFISYVAARGGSALRTDWDRVDVQFELKGRGLVLAEIKPCSTFDARYAIRTAIGQLVDYQHRHPQNPQHLLIVLEVKPQPGDIELAICNRFGIAYPRGTGFIVKWPA